MFSRCVAILIATWFPMLAVILPLGPAHTANTIVAGTVATLLSLASLSDNRARVVTAVVGGWVALAPFVFSSTLVEKMLTVSWGVTMFVCMIGPFSDKPVTILVPAATTQGPPVEVEPAFAKAGGRTCGLAFQVGLRLEAANPRTTEEMMAAR
jgi:hypothetical protein